MTTKSFSRRCGAFHHIAIAPVVCLVLCSCQPSKNLKSTFVPSRAVSSNQLSPSRNDMLHINSLMVAPLIFGPRVDMKGLNVEGLNAQSASAFKEEAGVDVVAASEALPAAKDGKKVEITPLDKTAADADFLFHAAQKKGCDGILFVTVHEFVERIGSSIGASRPASVSFTLGLQKTGGREVVWRRVYESSDEALTDNLFRLAGNPQPGQPKDGLVWHSASDLFTASLRQAARDFSKMRTDNFVSNTP